jgi:hypothetical protein
MQRIDRITEKLRHHWLVLALAAPLVVLWASGIDRREVCCDAYDNLRMAVSLAHEGVLSLDIEPPFEPTMYREPLPPVILAANIAALEVVAGEAPFQAYQDGSRTAWLKYQNTLWMLLIYIGSYFVMWRETRRRWLAAAVAVLSQGVFFYPGMAGYGVNTLFTEIFATGVLVVASLMYADAIRSASIPKAFAAGALLSALAMIKAVFFPVSLVLLACAPAMWFLRKPGVSRMHGGAVWAALVLAFSLGMTPWLARNHELFGEFKVSDRGGYSLITRAIHDDLVWPERYADSFYAFTPNKLKPIMGVITGNKEEDMLAGGALQQFNRFDYSGFIENDRAAMFAGRPEDAISYYYKGRAEWEKQKQRFREAGVEHPDLAADRYLTKRALQMFAADPVAHVAMILPMLWYGALFTFPLLAIVSVTGLIRRDPWLVAFVLPSLGMILFYACISNVEERYGVPAMPVALVGLGIILLQARRRAKVGA